MQLLGDQFWFDDEVEWKFYFGLKRMENLVAESRKDMQVHFF